MNGFGLLMELPLKAVVYPHKKNFTTTLTFSVNIIITIVIVGTTVNTLSEKHGLVARCHLARCLIGGLIWVF